MNPGGPRFEADPQDDDHLNEEELSALRNAMGRPSPEKINDALEQVAFQVALEDLALLIIEGLTETARTLIDAVAGIGDKECDGDENRSSRKDET